MSRMNEKQKLLTIAGVSIALTLGAGGGVYWAKDLVTVEAEAISQKRSQIQAAQTKIDKIRGEEEKVIILRENLDEYVKILPNNSEVEEFVQALYKFSSQTGVITVTVKPGRTGKSKGGFSKVAYEYSLEATLWQALEFMNLIESYDRFIKVTKFQLASKDAGNIPESQKVNGEIRHDITIGFETYVYQGGKGKGEVLIQNYTNKRDALKEEIFKSLQAIQIESYDFRGKMNRRDVFIDPRVSAILDDDQPNVPVPEQLALINKLGGEVEHLRQVFGRLTDKSVTVMERFKLRRVLEDGLSRARVDVEKANETGVITYRPYETQWNVKVEQPLAELRVDFDNFLVDFDGKGKVGLDSATLTELYQSMARSVRTGNLEEAIRRYQDVQEQLHVPSDDPRFQQVLDITTLYQKATVAKEFQRMKLDIRGVVVRDDGRSGVLLNNQVLSEGDYVGQDCFIKRVMNEQVAFVYKGLTLIKTF